jgi:uncharacterized protein YheU (UPF0270 family)
VIKIPASSLSREALRGVVEAYVLREGTDYGERETPFERKVAQVMGALTSGRAELTFDPATGTTTLIERQSG